VRAHVVAGRRFASLVEMDSAFLDWVPLRRAQVHRSHGEVIGVRAETDRGALGPLPERPYLVTERHLRTVGKDCLVSFESSLYSVPWRKVRRPMRVELRVILDEVSIWSLGEEPECLAVHPRAPQRGSWVVDESHWAGLPARDDAAHGTGLLRPLDAEVELMASRSKKAEVAVARRDLACYDHVGAVA
jgi:hypothetical protein